MNHRLLMGGMQESLIELDLTTAKELRQVVLDPGGSCAILRDHGKFVCCGDVMNGKVHLRDPRSLKREQETQRRGRGVGLRRHLFEQLGHREKMAVNLKPFIK